MISSSVPLGEANAAASSTVSTVKARLLADALQTRPASVDTLRGWLHDLSADGIWADINYHATADAGWQPSRHMDRVLQLSLVHAAPSTFPTLASAEVGNALSRAWEAWFHVLPGTTPQSENWWHNDIGIPLKFGAAMLLAENALTPAQKQAGLAVLARSWVPESTSGINTGANLVWRARITAARACLENDPTLLVAVSRRIAREIVMTDGEGLQPDFSFWQHGPQVQTLSYGVQLSDDASDIAALFHQTDAAFSPETLDNLTHLVLDGQQWAMRGPIGDFSVRGRGIAMAGNEKQDLRLVKACDRLIAFGGPRTKELQTFRDRMKGVANTPPLTGNRAFYRSGFMAHQRADYYAGVRVTSRFLRGMEVINGAGLRSQYLGDGVLCLYRTGHEYDNVFPLWDWNRLPGVTCLQKATQPLQTRGYNRGVGEFAGSASNGTIGATGYDYARDGVQAKKAWFFFDREIVCLGAGITSSEAEPVYTSVNQCRLAGKVATHGVADAAKTGDAPKQWVHHDGVGYVFPPTTQGQKIVVESGPKTGRWHDINDHDNSEPFTADVFSVWLDHGAKPQNVEYAYVLVPGVSAGELPAYAAESPISILANTPAVQAVSHKTAQQTQAVFYASGSVRVRDGFYLTVSHPCIVLVQESDAKTLTITVADPGNAPTRDYDESVQQFKPVANPPVSPVRVVVSVTQKLHGDGVTVEKTASTVAFDLPAGVYAGQSVSKTFAVL